jgi:putative aldouronate transport system substrate-binding protein
MVRKDWLDELGLQIPETIDEWYRVLKTFKEKKNIPTPLSFEYASFYDAMQFPYAYKVFRGFYIGDDGKIRFGSIENGFRDWLATFSQWYKEGLVDPDIVTLSFQQVTAKVLGGQTGVIAGTLASRMGTWITTARTSNPKFQLAGCPVPVLKKGDKPPLKVNLDNPYPGNGAAISGSCKNIELAARLLDWGYSQEGMIYFNYGTQGVSYTMVNGEPRYTPLILKNPDGWSMSQALSAYAKSASSGPFVQHGPFFEQINYLPEQSGAIKAWAGWEGRKHKVPPITPTVEESREFARIMNEVNAYRDEMFAKFLIGTESLSNWDNFVNTVKRMGIERAVEIQNAALARYNAR